MGEGQLVISAPNSSRRPGELDSMIWCSLKVGKSTDLLIQLAQRAKTGVNLASNAVNYHANAAQNAVNIIESVKIN